MIAFGPVPSRRLGYSLGINHIPPKHCPYSCVYCQVGRTTRMETARRSFYSLDQILQDVERKIAESTQIGAVIDYLTLVPDGEPTLDINLGKLIEGLKVFGIPIAVISNSSLINHIDVQNDLLKADWISLKVDTVDEIQWHRINRPHHRLLLSSILNGILNFRTRFRGELVTETMFVSELNDSEKAIQKVCDFLLELNPLKSFLTIPTRPPTEGWVTPPGPESLQRIFQIISDRILFADLLFEAESADFASTGNLVEDILSIAAVHPIREKALGTMLAQNNSEWMVVDELINSQELACIQYRDEKFYMRRFPGQFPKRQ